MAKWTLGIWVWFRQNRANSGNSLKIAVGVWKFWQRSGRAKIAVEFKIRANGQKNSGIFGQWAKFEQIRVTRENSKKKNGRRQVQFSTSGGQPEWISFGLPELVPYKNSWTGGEWHLPAVPKNFWASSMPAARTFSTRDEVSLSESWEKICHNMYCYPSWAVCNDF